MQRGFMALAVPFREAAIPVLAGLLALFHPADSHRGVTLSAIDRTTASKSSVDLIASRTSDVEGKPHEAASSAASTDRIAGEALVAAASANFSAATVASVEPTRLSDPGISSGSEISDRISTFERRGVELSFDSIEVVDECFVFETCVDRYLWERYQRARKEDSISVKVQTTVNVRRKGKMVAVNRTVTKSQDQDFGWKDAKAAEQVHMELEKYVIGGMDRDFKLKLFYMLHGAEAAGLAPGITSAFRDDYRQSIASGLKAASDKSYHGGSFRGGYGHGLAADIVSTNGATRSERQVSTRILWRWVDAHESEFGIGRPYLNRDPPHVGPVDGQEYADKRFGTKLAAGHAAVIKVTEARAK